MPTFQPIAVDSPPARALLHEYFHSREIGFAHQQKTYAPTSPDPAVYTEPAGAFVLVIGDEGTPVGCGGLRRIADGLVGVRYEVKHLYLRPETRGRGWGSLLLADLETRARVWGAAEIVLDTHHSLTAAAALYRSAGFVETEAFNDNPNASRWYAKPLGRAETA